MRLVYATSAAAVLLTAARLTAQQPPPTPPAAPPAPAAVPAHANPPAVGDEDKPKFDPEAIERGKQIHVQQCGFCHGTSARGGAQGPDLTRSPLVQSDENGKQLGEFLKVGRPEKNMPAFPHLAEGQDLLDLATFLHATIDSVADRGRYKILDILVGDAKRGQAFFFGAGKCSSCHSPTGDLKGIGAKYEDAVTLQGRLVMPRGRRRGPAPGQSEPPPYQQSTAVKATVTLPSGASVTGPLVRLTDFDVTIYDPATRQMRSWLRHDGTPAVTVTDPLQAHVDMLRRWKDADMHDMTAFLATLK